MAVFAGSEPGVLLAEELAEALDLPCNGAATKEWRRDKYAQQERLRECGIRAIKQLYSGDLEEILAWREQWGKWPVIVKPAMSGGTDGVYWCHCDDDIKLAHAEECGKRCKGQSTESTPHETNYEDVQKMSKQVKKQSSFSHNTYGMLICIIFPPLNPKSVDIPFFHPSIPSLSSASVSEETP